MKRKQEEASDSDEDNEPRLISRRKTTKDESKKVKEKRRDVFLDDFTTVDVSKEKLLSHLFHNKEFSVMPLEQCGYSTHEIERDVLLNGGKVVKNPLRSTHFIVTNETDFRLRSFERFEHKKFIFIKPKYIKNCIAADKILPLSPLYLTVLTAYPLKFGATNTLFTKHSNTIGFSSVV